MAAVKKYSVFTEAQQAIYSGLREEQRLYIEYRRQGATKSDAYRMAYNYGGERSSQCAQALEKRTPEIADLVEVLINAQRSLELEHAKKGDLNAIIDAKAKQQGAEEAIAAIEGADSETARRIQFYRDIIAGKIKPKKTTKKYDAKGKLISTQVVESTEPAVMMQAREKLDTILGLNKVVKIDTLTCAGITVEIVDASEKAIASPKEDEDFIDVTEEEIEVGSDE